MFATWIILTFAILCFMMSNSCAMVVELESLRRLLVQMWIPTVTRTASRKTWWEMKFDDTEQWPLDATT